MEFKKPQAAQTYFITYFATKIAVGGPTPTTLLRIFVGRTSPHMRDTIRKLAVVLAVLLAAGLAAGTAFAGKGGVPNGGVANGGGTGAGQGNGNGNGNGNGATQGKGRF
jgi:hypothetical protein